MNPPSLRKTAVRRLRLAAAGGVSTVVGMLLAVACHSPSEPACSYTLSTGSTVEGPAGGGSFPVTVTTGSGCAWSAVGYASWIHAQAPTSGTGTGVFTFTVDANTGAPRSGTLVIAGTTVMFNQAAGTTFTLSAVLAQGHHLSGPYAATLTGPGGFSCSLRQDQETVDCPPVLYVAGTSVPLVVTITIPSFANADPIWSTSGCDSVTINTCTVLMTGNRNVTIRAGKL